MLSGLSSLITSYQDEGALSRFMDKYATYTKIEGGPAKLIPKVNNPEQLQAEIAPIMIRHTRDEPCVVRNIEPRHSRIVPIRVDMDPLHRAFYQKWLDQFVTWFIGGGRGQESNWRWDYGEAWLSI